ncbi:MAG: hypothetical protein Q6K18_04225, partial [Gloeomargarita sp. DG_1_5_bins_55]
VETISKDEATLTPLTKDSVLRQYAAGVERDVLKVTLPSGLSEFQVTDAPVLCESIAPNQGVAVTPPMTPGDGELPTCPGGYINILNTAD